MQLLLNSFSAILTFPNTTHHACPALPLEDVVLALVLVLVGAKIILQHWQQSLSQVTHAHKIHACASMEMKPPGLHVKRMEPTCVYLAMRVTINLVILA